MAHSPQDVSTLPEYLKYIKTLMPPLPEVQVRSRWGRFERARVAPFAVRVRARADSHAHPVMQFWPEPSSLLIWRGVPPGFRPGGLGIVGTRERCDALVDGTRAILCLRCGQVEFEEISYSKQVPVLEEGVENIGTVLAGAFLKRRTKTRSVLAKCSGVLSPGTLTLVRVRGVWLRLWRLAIHNCAAGAGAPAMRQVVVDEGDAPAAALPCPCPSCSFAVLAGPCRKNPLP